MRLLPGRWWSVPVIFLFGAVFGLLFITENLILGLVAAAVFGTGAAVASLALYSTQDTRMLRLLEMLPQTIVVNVNLDVPSTRRVSRLPWSTRAVNLLGQVSLSIDDESFAFWTGSRRPVLLARIPWGSVHSFAAGVARPHLSKGLPYPQALLIARDEDSYFDLQFAVLPLPGEEPEQYGGYVDPDGIQLLIHYAKARRHGTMPPKPAAAQPAAKVPLRNLVVPIVVGATILIAFGVVVAIGLSSS